VSIIVIHTFVDTQAAVWAYGCVGLGCMGWIGREVHKEMSEHTAIFCVFCVCIVSHARALFEHEYSVEHCHTAATPTAPTVLRVRRCCRWDRWESGCIIVIDTIIMTNYTNNAYIYDTYLSRRGRISYSPFAQ
jgi:hypothetical protein